MKTIKILLSRKEIIEEAARIAVCAGVRRPGVDGESLESEFMRVRASPTDRILLLGYMEGAIAIALESFKDDVAASELTDTGWSLQLNVSASYDETLNAGFRWSLRVFIVSDILRRWFGITLPDRAAEYANEAERALRDCRRKLCHRLPPKRKAK